MTEIENMSHATGLLTQVESCKPGITVSGWEMYYLNPISKKARYSWYGGFKTEQEIKNKALEEGLVYVSYKEALEMIYG